MAKTSLPYVVYTAAKFDEPAHPSEFRYLLHKAGGRVLSSIALRRLNAGVVLNIHLGKSGDAIPIADGDTLDLTGYNFAGDLYVSVDTYVGAVGTGLTYGTFLVAFDPEPEF